MIPRALLPLALLLLGSGCASDAASPTRTASTQELAAAGPPSLESACGSDSGIRARSLWLQTDDNVRLFAVEAGRGSVAIVLAHEGRSNLCGELPYAKTLIAAGLRVLAFDFRGNGQSEAPAKNALDYRRDFTAVIQQVRDDGARRVFLAGASMGGAAAVQNSGGLPFAGVISLSGTRLWPGFGINKPGPRALRSPFLYLGGRDDWRAPLDEAKTIFRTAGSRDKRSAFYRGGFHGWTLVDGAPFERKARGLVLDWIHAHA